MASKQSNGRLLAAEFGIGRVMWCEINRVISVSVEASL